MVLLLEVYGKVGVGRLQKCRCTGVQGEPAVPLKFQLTGPNGRDRRWSLSLRLTDRGESKRVHTQRLLWSMSEATDAYHSWNMEQMFFFFFFFVGELEPRL